MSNPSQAQSFSLQQHTRNLLTMSDTREDSVYLAKLAEQAERYEGEFTGIYFSD